MPTFDFNLNVFNKYSDDIPQLVFQITGPNHQIVYCTDPFTPGEHDPIQDMVHLETPADGKPISEVYEFELCNATDKVTYLDLSSELQFENGKGRYGDMEMVLDYDWQGIEEDKSSDKLTPLGQHLVKSLRRQVNDQRDKIEELRQEKRMAREEVAQLEAENKALREKLGE